MTTESDAYRLGASFDLLSRGGSFPADRFLAAAVFPELDNSQEEEKRTNHTLAEMHTNHRWKLNIPAIGRPTKRRNGKTTTIGPENKIERRTVAPERRRSRENDASAASTRSDAGLGWSAARSAARECVRKVGVGPGGAPGEKHRGKEGSAKEEAWEESQGPWPRRNYRGEMQRRLYLADGWPTSRTDGCLRVFRSRRLGDCQREAIGDGHLLPLGRVTCTESVHSGHFQMTGDTAGGATISVAPGTTNAAS